MRYLTNPLRITALAAIAAATSAMAEPTVLPIWPEGVPDLKADASPEKLENNRASNIHQPSLTIYPAPKEKANGTAIVVCPGGGYVRLSMENEGSKLAEWFNNLGITVFVLKYRLVEYGHPAPLRDVTRAIRLVRSHAAEYGISPDRIGIIGASAGGHLASCASTLYDDPEAKTGAALDAVSARPDFAILMYPVITMKDPYVHAGSRKALLGENPSPELIEKMSTELHVTKSTPPTFLLHTTEDKSVPAENSIQYYEALRKAGVSAELHVFEKGPHGVGIRPGFGHTSDWPLLCEGWLKDHGWLSKP